MKNGFFRMIFCLSVLLNVCAFAEAGTETGNAGDYISQDFVTSAQEGIKILKQHSLEFPFIDVEKIQASIDSAKVEALASGTSFPNGIRTAENFPISNKIIVNGDRWENIKEPARKMALALHEYLGLTGYEINNYIITSQLFGITRDQMEAPPTITELDHSFDSLRSSYMKMLMAAKNLTPTLVYYQGNSITVSECIEFIKTQIITPPGVFFDAGCIDSYKPEIILATQSGTTNLGASYSSVLSISFGRQGMHQNHYLINSNGQIVEKYEYENQTDKLINKLVALDVFGNGYEHDQTLDFTSSNSPISEYSSVVLANGSLGTEISQYDSIVDGKPFPSIVKFAATNFSNWQQFNIGLYNSLFIPKEVWGTTANDTFGGMIYSYKYLNQQFSMPDNFRSITYLVRDSKITQMVGSYIANRREYKIK